MTVATASSPDVSPDRSHERAGLGRSWRAWLVGAVLVGLLVRLPGVFWGANFPLGWYGHHIDEYTHLVNAELIINPTVPPRWPPHPYPKATAAHVALPLVAIRAAQGKLFEGLPEPRTIITIGRVVSVLYGAATIVVVALLGLRLFRDSRVALFAAWITALGGLHVSQSHFFLADVPTLFWQLLGSYCLLREMSPRSSEDGRFLWGAAFCFGAAFGLKLWLAGFVPLALAIWLGAPRTRLVRLVQAMAFVITGFVLISGFSDTASDLLKKVLKAPNDPYQFSRAFSALVYAIQLPSLVSIPVLLLASVGAWTLGRRLLRMEWGPEKRAVLVAVVLPVALTLIFVLPIDNFLRHLLVLVPWMGLLGGWALASLVDRLRTHKVRPALVVAPVFIYLAVFVADGERLYVDEPRNKAADWLLANVPRGTTLWWQGHGWITNWEHVRFPRERAEVLVIEMHRANEYLSGMGFKNSMPRNRRFIFGMRSQKEIDALQALFNGTSDYREVARFSEGYVMPEYRLVDWLLGDRSRNYLTEIVIFRSKGREENRARHET